MGHDNASLAYAEGCRNLIEKFLNHDVNAQTFEHQFLEMFKKEPPGLPDDIFQIIDRLFAEVDAFCPDPSIRSRTSDGISEEQLRERCAGILREIESKLKQRR